MNEIEEFIKHHGVKGQRWGVRRKSNSSKGRSGRTTFKKDPHRLSDAELKRRIQRLELEKKYADLNAPIKSSGHQYARSLLEGQGKSIVGAIVGTTATFIVQRELKRRFPAIDN